MDDYREDPTVGGFAGAALPVAPPGFAPIVPSLALPRPQSPPYCDVDAFRAETADAISNLADTTQTDREVIGQLAASVTTLQDDLCARDTVIVSLRDEQLCHTRTCNTLQSIPFLFNKH